jgi:hypothetical protein
MHDATAFHCVAVPIYRALLTRQYTMYKWSSLFLLMWTSNPVFDIFVQNFRKYMWHHMPQIPWEHLFQSFLLIFPQLPYKCIKSTNTCVYLTSMTFPSGKRTPINFTLFSPCIFQSQAQLPIGAPFIIVTPNVFQCPLWHHHQGLQTVIIIEYPHDSWWSWLVCHSYTIGRMASSTSSVCEISHGIGYTVQGYIASQNGLYLSLKH